MKKVKIVLVALGIIVVSTAVLLFIPLGTQNYESKISGITLNVPRFSFLKEECCAYNVDFVSLRSVDSLRKELERELSKYETITCDNKTYYYDSKQDFTITEYNVNNGFILNDFNITYDKVKYCD